jgi:hypothetical protein
MKVVELINKLNEIGYDENTELTFGFTDGNTGEWYTAPFDEINYGIDLTGEPYHNDVINIDVDVDSVKEYQKDKAECAVIDIVEEMQDVLNKYQRKLIF